MGTLLVFKSSLMFDDISAFAQIPFLLSLLWHWKASRFPSGSSMLDSMWSSAFFPLPGTQAYFSTIPPFPLENYLSFTKYILGGTVSTVPCPQLLMKVKEVPLKVKKSLWENRSFLYLPSHGLGWDLSNSWVLHLNFSDIYFSESIRFLSLVLYTFHQF